jgi:hypothetical protein
MTVSHKIIKNSLEGISAMNRIKRIIKSSNFEGNVFPFSPLYSIWEIDEVSRVARFFLEQNTTSSCF